MHVKQEISTRLEKLIAAGTKYAGSYQQKRLNEIQFFWDSPHAEAELRSFVTSARAEIVRIAGENSQYFHEAQFKTVPKSLKLLDHSNPSISTITGVLQSLKDAVDHDLLVSLEAKLSAAIHDDLLVQAETLLKSKPSYFQAAMVLIGGVVENHLRKLLAARPTLPLKGKPGINSYNDTLKDNAYDTAIWRRIQGIGDLRNEAAHNDIKTLDEDHTKDAFTFVQKFLADHSA